MPLSVRQGRTRKVRRKAGLQTRFGVLLLSAAATYGCAATTWSGPGLAAGRV